MTNNLLTITTDRNSPLQAAEVAAVTMAGGTVEEAAEMTCLHRSEPELWFACEMSSTGSHS